VSPARTITARDMAAAVERDPQLARPVRPKLVDGLVVVALDDGLLIEGGPERQVLRGRASADVVPRLLELLDGSRDAAELSEALGDVSERKVSQALALLFACGLLEAPSPQRPDSLVATWLSRVVDSTRVNRHGTEAVERLRSSAVAIAAGAPLAAELGDLLLEHGVGAAIPLANDGALEDTVTLVVAGGALGARAGDLLALDERCAAAGVPWLHVGVDGEAFVLGPLFERPHRACYACYTARHAPSESEPRDRPARLELLARVALEIVHLCARVGTALSPRGAAIASFGGEPLRVLSVPRRPGCPTCCPRGPLRPAPLAFDYEEAVAFPPRHHIAPKDHQHHYRPSNIELARDLLHVPGAPRVTLPPGDAPPPQRAAGALLDRATLGALLARAVGLRSHGDGRVVRWAPTGGNLGSPQAYLVASEIGDVPDGIFAYLPDEPALARLPDSVATAAIVAGATAAGTLVLTGQLARVMRKYGAFAYRIVHLDAGCALAQLATAAAQLAVDVHPADDWDEDALAAALGLDRRAELVTAVLSLLPGDMREGWPWGARA
jgi:SagB-type dehydrogenase family enzyme